MKRTLSCWNNDIVFTQIHLNVNLTKLTAASLVDSSGQRSNSGGQAQVSNIAASSQLESESFLSGL